MDQMTRGMLKVTVDRSTGIVRFDVLSKNRELSALVSRRILDLVNDFNLRRKQSQAGAEREFAARRARAALDTLHSAENALADFRATNIDFSRSPRSRDAGVRVAASGGARATDLYDGVAAIRARQYRSRPQYAVITVLDPPEGLVESAAPLHAANRARRIPRRPVRRGPRWY
jgi:hypothetical protein